MINLLKYTDINFDNITYLPIQKLDDENYYIKIKYNLDNDSNIYPLTIQIPYMYVPYGIASHNINNTNFLDLIISDNESKFKDFLLELDKKIYKDSIKNIKNWFNNLDTTNKNNEDINNTLQSNYNSQIINDNSYENDFNFFRIFLPKNINNNWEFDMFDDSKNSIDIQKNLIDDIYVRCIIICDGIWIFNNEFGLSWRLVQIQRKNEINLNQYLFID